MGRRIVWVDYAKGIAILGVLLLHTEGHLIEGLGYGIGAFDMMLFFALSGYVFSIKKYAGFVPFLWSRVRTLVVPGLVFGFLALPLQWVLNFSPAMYTDLPNNAVRWLLGLAVNLRGGGLAEIPWFLACLFVMEIGAYVVLRVIGSRDHDIAMLAGLAVLTSLIGYGYSVLIHKALPWSGDIAMSLFCFFLLGMLVKRLGDGVIDRMLAPAMILPSAVLFVASVVLNVYLCGGEAVNAYLNRYGNYACFIVGAVSGIWMICALCSTIERVKPLDAVIRRPLLYLGRNTLVIYCVNGLIYPVIIPWALSGLDVSTPTGRMLWVVASLVVNLIVCSIVASLVNRFLPELLGRKRGA